MKKILSICLSILMVLLILPAREVNAADTINVYNLSGEEVLKKGDTIYFNAGSGNQNFFVVKSTMFGPGEIPTPVNSFVLDKDYIFEGWDDMDMDGISVYLYPCATVEIYVGLQLRETKTFIYDALVGVDDTNQIYINYFDDVYRYSTITPLGSSYCWTWETDKNPGQPKTFSYYGDEGSSTFPLKDLYDSESKIKLTYETYTPALTNFKVVGKSTVAPESSNTYIISMLDQFGYVMDGTGRSISITKLDPTTGNPTGDPAEQVSFNDGFSYTMTAPATGGDVVFKVTINNPQSGEENINNIFAVHVEEPEVVNDLENNSWPWGTTFTNAKATLKTGLKINTFDVDPAYQWQSSDNNYSFTDIASANEQTYDVTTANDGTWYRCKVTYTPVGGSETTLTTKAVQVIDDVHIQMSASGLSGENYIGSPFPYQGKFYVSNGKGAYTVDKATGKFNVLGLWNDLWVHTSYDPNWSIYMKESDSDPESPTPVALSNIKDIYPRFVDYNGSEVIFDVRFNTKCDVAIYTDVCIGSSSQFGGYTDYAAVKANLQGNELANVQLFAKENFQSGTNDTCTFVMTPILSSVHTGSNLPNVSTFAVDSYNNTDEDNDHVYVCDDNPTTSDYYDYDEMVGYLGFGIFNYNQEIRPDCEDWGNPDSMYYPIVGGTKMCVSIYDEDSILAMSWSGVTEISYMFGIGKAGELQGVTFTDIKDPEEEEEHHSGGSAWIEVPNTSASVR